MHLSGAKYPSPRHSASRMQQNDAPRPVLCAASAHLPAQSFHIVSDVCEVHFALRSTFARPTPLSHEFATT